MDGRKVGRIPVLESEVLAADVPRDEETEIPLEWTHDGGRFRVLGAQPVRVVEQAVDRVFYLFVIPASDNFGPWPLSGRRS